MTTKAERETILRWDREGNLATFYSADASEARRWKRLGYSVVVHGVASGTARSWTADVPIEAVALLSLRDGRVKAPRWLEPPTLWDGAEKAQEPREPEKIDENIQQIDANSPSGGRTPAG